jgi:hypothetical protein
MRKKYWQIGGFTLFQAIVSLGLFFYSFGAGSRRFDTGAPAGIGDKSVGFLSNLLFWPIFYPLVQWGPREFTKFFSRFLGYIPVLLNSLVWGISFWWFYSRYNKALKPTGPYSGLAT